MSSFHKPRIFRSTLGCCICKAKSSSSRFTDSGRYSEAFLSCFKLIEERAGDICNACVLLIKRWRKLPRGTDRHWAHVVDARAGPGTKSTVRRRKEVEHLLKEEPLKGAEQLSRQRRKKHVWRRRGRGVGVASSGEDGSDSDGLGSLDLPGFIDPTFWKREKICCGVIYRGLGGEIMLDRSQYRPCAAAQLTACQLMPPAPPRPVAAEPSLPSSLFARSRLEEIIERELRDLNAREVAPIDCTTTTTTTTTSQQKSVPKSTDDLSDATSVTSTESDEGFYDRMSRHEIEPGQE